jgi:rhamnogalacturonan endolyase
MPIASGTGFALVERLDRGVVAVRQEGGVYVGWRMFGYEYRREEPQRVTYLLYRDGALLAEVADSTNFFDATGDEGSSYEVAVSIDGVEGERSPPVLPWAESFTRVPLERPSPSYNAHDASVGDVDGDGRYELFMLWQPNDARDNSQAGVTSDVFIDALRLDGTRLWRINLGPNIRAGEHYTQFVVIDADGDGRAELAVKTAPGTRAGDGAPLSLGPAANDDDGAVYRNGDGYILSGPEYLTVFEGATGRELATAEFQVARGQVSAWGDNYGNRVDRFLASAAYLDDTGLPSIVMARGYYTRTTLAAWSYRGGELRPVWVFDSDETPRDSRGQPFTGQGAHAMSVANVDAVPMQELIYGELTVDHDGAG